MTEEQESPTPPSASRPTFVERSEVSGELDIISVRRTPHFVLYEHGTERSVRCVFPDSMMPQVKEALGRRIVVEGFVQYRVDGSPMRVTDVTRFYVLPEPQRDIEDFRGTLPFGGDLPTGELVHRLRVADDDIPIAVVHNRADADQIIADHNKAAAAEELAEALRRIEPLLMGWREVIAAIDDLPKGEALGKAMWACLDQIDEIRPVLRTALAKYQGGDVMATTHPSEHGCTCGWEDDDHYRLVKRDDACTYHNWHGIPATPSPFRAELNVWSVIEDETDEHHWWLVDHPWKGGFACVSEEAATFAANLLNRKSNDLYRNSAKAVATDQPAIAEGRSET